MSDRSYCTLYLAEPATDGLMNVLEEELGPPSDQSEGGTFFGYDEVNWATLLDAVSKYLDNHDFGYL